jgi:hypothetical protein
VSWSGTRNQQPSGPTTITLAGDLIVTVGSRRSRVRELVVDNVQFADPLANIFRLRTDSLRIEFAGLPFRAN